MPRAATPGTAYQHRHTHRTFIHFFLGRKSEIPQYSAMIQGE